VPVMNLDPPWTGDENQEPTLEHALNHARLLASSRVERRLAQAYYALLAELDEIKGSLNEK
jgi:hypothetical protein